MGSSMLLDYVVSMHWEWHGHCQSVLEASFVGRTVVGMVFDLRAEDSGGHNKLMTTLKTLQDPQEVI